MKCPYCKTGNLKQTTKYDVQGTKHYIPGQVSIYKCLKCGQKERFFTSRETLYLKKLQMFKDWMNEDRERLYKKENRFYEIASQFHTGHVRRQVENIQKVLASFLKSLP